MGCVSTSTVFPSSLGQGTDRCPNCRIVTSVVYGTVELVKGRLVEVSGSDVYYCGFCDISWPTEWNTQETSK